MKSTTLKIEGMRCSGCARTIKTLIEREAGVKAGDVSFEATEARVLFDPQAIDESGIAATIERAGYRVIR